MWSALQYSGPEVVGFTLGFVFAGSSEVPAIKVKAEPIPTPRKPPVKNQKLVGPLNPTARGRLSPGDWVEVRQQAPGFRGSWYPAKTLQVRTCSFVNPIHFYIHFQSLCHITD